MVSFAPTRTQLVTLHLHPHLSHSLDDCWGDRPCNPSPPYTVPYRIVWASPADLSTYPNHFNLHFFIVVKVLLWDPMACRILYLTASLVMWFLYEMPTVSKASHLRGLQFLLDVRYQWPGFAGVQECRDNQGAHELREIFSSFQITQMVFSFDRATVICAILDSTLGLEPWSMMTVPTHLKLSILSSFLPLTLTSTLTPFFIRHQFGLLSRRSSFVVPFARSAIPCLFFFCFLRSLYLLLVLLFHVFSSSVVFVRCTFCPFFYPMSFSLQFSSFVVPFARSTIPCLFFFSSPRSLYLLPVLLSHAFFTSVLFVRQIRSTRQLWLKIF